MKQWAARTRWHGEPALWINISCRNLFREVRYISGISGIQFLITHSESKTLLITQRQKSFNLCPSAQLQQRGLQTAANALHIAAFVFNTCRNRDGGIFCSTSGQAYYLEGFTDRPANGLSSATAYKRMATSTCVSGSTVRRLNVNPHLPIRMENSHWPWQRWHRLIK